MNNFLTLNAALKPERYIVLDSCAVISMLHYFDPSYDPDNVVHQLLDEKRIYPMYFDSKNLPKILQDKYLGYAAVQVVRGNMVLNYWNLLSYHKIVKYCADNNVRFCITPTAYAEINAVKSQTQSEIFKELFYVLQVPTEYSVDFYTARNQLANKYIESGAMKNQLDLSTMTTVPRRDSYIMAEATMFGMYVFTNDSDYICDDNKRFQENKFNAERKKLINKINADMGYCFVDESGNKFVPEPINAFTFSASLAKNNLRFASNPNMNDFYGLKMYSPKDAKVDAGV